MGMSKLLQVAITLVLVACSGGGGGSGGDDAAVASDGRAAIDGGMIDATAAVDASMSTDPGLTGPSQVLVQDNVAIAVGTATVRGTVFSPSTDGTTPAPGPFPLVIISSGFQLNRAQYALYGRHLASWSYVAITHDYAASGNHQAKAREVGQIIDWALGPTSGLAARIQPEAIGVAGHSLGGKVSINAAILDARIKAVVGWDPVDALPPFGNDGSMSVTPEMMGNLRVPLALLGELTDSVGGMSCAPAADNYQQYFIAACRAPDRLEVTIDLADHMDWIGDRSTCGLACLVCRNGETPDTTVQTITKRVTTAFLERHLRHTATLDPFLTAPLLGTPTSLRTTAPGC
jgi:dienelactone hydrolase